MTVYTLTSALLDVCVLKYAGLWRSTARDRFNSFGRLIRLEDGNLWGAKVEGRYCRHLCVLCKSPASKLCVEYRGCFAHVFLPIHSTTLSGEPVRSSGRVLGLVGLHLFRKPKVVVCSCNSCNLIWKSLRAFTFEIELI